MNIKHLDLNKFVSRVIEFVEKVVFDDCKMHQSFSLKSKDDLKIGLELMIRHMVEKEDLDTIEIYNKYLEEKRKDKKTENLIN